MLRFWGWAITNDGLSICEAGRATGVPRSMVNSWVGVVGPTLPSGPGRTRYGLGDLLALRVVRDLRHAPGVDAGTLRRAIDLVRRAHGDNVLGPDLQLVVTG